MADPTPIALQQQIDALSREILTLRAQLADGLTIPDMDGHSGKVLGTDGIRPGWVAGGGGGGGPAFYPFVFFP